MYNTVNFINIFYLCLFYPKVKIPRYIRLVRPNKCNKKCIDILHGLTQSEVYTECSSLGKELLANLNLTSWEGIKKPNAVKAATKNKTIKAQKQPKKN